MAKPVEFLIRVDWERKLKELAAAQGVDILELLRGKLECVLDEGIAPDKLRTLNAEYFPRGLAFTLVSLILDAKAADKMKEFGLKRETYLAEACLRTFRDC